MKEESNTLATLPSLGATIPADLDAHKVAQEWFTAFSTYITNQDVEGVLSLFLETSFWRDILALTWDFRTFATKSRIRHFLTDRLPLVLLTNLALRTDFLQLQQPYPDLAWIQAFFDFHTPVGIGSGVLKLVPTANGEWKAYTIFTNLEDLKGFPEKIGLLRDFAPSHGKWREQRHREREFLYVEPTVVIIGGGHSGLDVAARLKCLGVSSLVVEKNERIGDNWRGRYEALCLHDPVWYDHMPYLPFPPTWPVCTPAPKLANWLEHYAESMELNVWTSTEVTKATRDETNNTWNITVKRSSGPGQMHERDFKVKYMVFATGVGSGEWELPSIPGMNTFKGQILHSEQHKKAVDHAGKKVVVVGACNSAHDICADYYEHGVDVTMFQRSSTYVMSTKNGWKYQMQALYWEGGPPVDIADRISASLPKQVQIELAKRATRAIAEADRDILDGLNKRGFKTNFGQEDTGFLLLIFNKTGGFYLDVGASQLIIDGKIKLKSGTEIERFTENGLRFTDGSELEADVVLFATGLGDPKNVVKRICGEEVASKSSRIWGLDEEGEVNGTWRYLGLPGVWYMMGNLAFCRFHSKHVALQIKAMEEGVFGTCYSLSKT